MEVCYLALLLCAVWHSVDALSWNLIPNTQKCLKEELHANVLVVGKYAVQQVAGQRVDYIVRDSKGQIFSQKENISEGKISFVTDAYDTFEVCFISKVGEHMREVNQEVTLDIKIGVEAKSYEGNDQQSWIGEANKLKPMELELKILEDLSEAIVQDFTLMRKREEEMRDTNESTNNRVLYFSIFSMLCLLGLATWQVLYLRRYFKAKKLIE